MFADDQAMFSELEDYLQNVVRLENIANGFNMRISTTKTKTRNFRGNNT
jgi:hypothetical protein